MGVAHQRDSHPVDRSDIIAKAQQVCVAMGIEPIKDGWFRCFSDRYPDLVDRLSQTISRVRNEANEAGLEDLYHRIAKVVIEGNYDASRIFNMDETAFANRQKTKRVISLRGSKSVHNMSITSNFHLTLVVCCSANGFVIPPLLILPGQRIDGPTADACIVEGAQLTTNASGFMTGDIFVKWVAMFAASVPDEDPRPLLLVCDGYDRTRLPSGQFDLVQPLDVSVFAPFKRTLRKEMRKYMLDTHSFNVTKPAALEIVSKAWPSIQGKNSVAGFKSCGLYPPSLPAILSRLKRFRDGGARVADRTAAWAKEKEHVHAEILVLPPTAAQASRKRKTIDVDGRLMTPAMVDEELSVTTPKKKRAKKVPQEAPPEASLEALQWALEMPCDDTMQVVEL
ncbi:hypothetical protein ACHHYP_13523 [Achlya hypogyna]|uniref:DDE-1 domain-containing protein n=1 Tax=Achlya hypogyna TaxID=1202772 RepID=A0A1V9YFA7_ACHHY|nr:hypothetical protein ACHHYP_13523 [Achlya hypogyna]